jgi:cellulose synthase/poly-beta-1,6-N-acetylglucosamine synthase-like glycosyltransferase
MEDANVVFREARGKYDAINFGLGFVPPDTDVVAFNDVDTRIGNWKTALNAIQQGASLVFAKVDVPEGPQRSFYRYLDFVRKRVPVAASGELMLVNYDFLKGIMPLRRCKAEDSYILFKTLERGGRVVFCEECSVTTYRTELPEEEEGYKRRTVGGIYQALSMTKPPFEVTLFYTLLPFVAPMLLMQGRNGYFWAKGILLGFVDFLRGDRTGSWKSIGNKSRL